MREVCFVWEDEEGNVRVTHPVWRAQKPRETDDQFLERVVRKSVPQGRQVHAINPRALPKDRSARRDWKLSDGMIKVVTAEKSDRIFDGQPA